MLLSPRIGRVKTRARLNGGLSETGAERGSHEIASIVRDLFSETSEIGTSSFDGAGSPRALRVSRTTTCPELP